MKTIKYFAPALCAVAGLLMLGACSKQTEPKPTLDQGATAPSSAASDVQKSLGKAADQVKDAVQTTAGEAQKAATDAAAAVQTKAQGIIDQAKSLVGDGKYPEAMTLLQQKLTGLQLTPDQQKLVDGLKAQIQKALGSAAAKTAGDAKKLLGQ